MSFYNEEPWPLRTVLFSLVPLFLYYLVTLAIYCRQCCVYPVYFAPRSPLLTICASVLGLAINMVGFLRHHYVNWFPCAVVYWTLYVGMIGWQLLVTARAYRLYCAINRHACLVEVAPWQINNTGHLDAAWIKQNQSKRAERRFYLAMGVTMFLAIIMVLTIQLITQQQHVSVFGNGYYGDDKVFIYYIHCPTLPWTIYPFFVIWGLLLVYTVPAGIYYLRKYPDHFGVRMELAAISIIALLTFLSYLIWTISMGWVSIVWPTGMFLITHTISTVMPIYEGWRRRKLAERVTNIRFEEALNEDNDVWRAFFQYAARDFCAENVCFIEQYRKLIHRTEQTLAIEGDDTDDAGSQPSISTEQPRHCRRSSSLQLSSSYAKRIYHRIRKLSKDDGNTCGSSSNYTDYAEANKLIRPSGSIRRPYRIRRLPSASETVIHDLNSAIKLTDMRASIITTGATITTSKVSMSSSPPTPDLQCQRPHSRSLPSSTTDSDSPFAFTAIDVADIDQKATPLTERPNAKVPMSLVSAYRALFETFIVDGAPLQLNISHATRVQATNRIRSYNYTIGMYAEVYAEIKWALWVNTFPKFLQAYERDLRMSDDATIR
ncbi:hypothetical protein BDF22DRAFT_777922 [Syncephalis plumigaleata]|nr:hypothetical protein BDF22DRAFT_777922 [Syncephalis plumigaleata]